MGKKKQRAEKTSLLPEARIILFTGKGGVGKTSVSAATAVRCAEAGLGTLIMSTDAAHSLSDAFDFPVKHLWAQEINVNHQISNHWGAIHTFLMQFLKRRGFDSVIADELAIPPGIEEIFSLLALMEHANDERFKVVIIDCAPTADTARLLAIPDIIQWYMEKIFHIERAVIRTVRPVAKRLTDAPLPPDEVFDSVEQLYHKIIGVKELLTDRSRTSIRMVVNPEKMVIKEAQRAYTVMNLFDFG
ncbi:MAG: ArsA family ATPase, partial [Deltaproteobacteria bacterium]|nr:ArsA family ATPase [Deltaproteobacteria bacterium]